MASYDVVSNVCQIIARHFIAVDFESSFLECNAIL